MTTGKILGVVISLLLGMGAAQVCDLTNNLTTDFISFIPVDVNLTQTSCFICPESATYFSINDQITTSGSGVAITNTTLTISNWSAYDVSMTTINRLSCEELSSARLITTLFFTLTPGPLTLRKPVPTFFFENSSSNTDILCVNNNRRPGYDTQIQVWTDSDGTVVGNGRTLMLTQLRDNAGTYICGISSIPIIPVVTYDLVIYYAPEVTTFNRNPEYVEVGATLILRCGYDGVPESNVTWIMNSTMLDPNANSDIFITSVITGEKRRITTLTWNNVPVSAQGVYYCLINNIAGSANGSYTIPIASAAQVCDLTNNLTTDSSSFIPIDVNLTQTSCFRCPEAATSFTINNQIITSGSDIVITSTTLMISNWSVYDVSMTHINRLSCIQQSDGRTITTLFFTLTPGSLTLHQPVPTFFLENSSSNIDIICINNNQRLGYNIQTQVWTDSDGTVVGNGRTLVLTQLRDNVGTYICSISSIPIIPVVMYDVVIYYGPEVTTFIRNPEYVEVGATLTLSCGYDSVPESNVTWTINSTVLDPNANSDISISSMPTGGNRRTTTLTWNNVPVSAQGVYYCLINNIAGSANGSYTITIATRDEDNNIAKRLSAVYTFSKCPSEQAKEVIMEDVIMFLSLEFGVSHVGLTRSSAASSCEQALHAHPGGRGFLYWTINGNVTKQQYC